VDLHALPGDALVDRGRLRQQLEAAGAKVVLLQAPAGYGKSVLLAQWAAHDPRPFASVTLSGLHDDPAQLLASVFEALATVEPVSDDLVSALGSPEPNLAVVGARLERELAAREVPMVLVLDELEHVGSEPSMEIIGAIARGLPAGSQLALASRAETLPHAGRLRANRQLLELGQAELTMTSGECQQLLARIGVEPSPEELSALVARTEGWAAALYLAGISLRDTPQADASAASFAGDERIVVDYMREELLTRAPREWVEFLTRTSICDRLSGGLCDAVLGQEGSAATLRELSRRNLLVIPLDRRDEWFRLHSLLARMLRTELGRAEPELIGELHGRASRWWETEGDSARAIDHAIEADDLDRAGQLLWRAVPEYNASGRAGTLRRWIERFSQEQIVASPALSLTVGHGQLVRGEGDLAAHWSRVTHELLVGREAGEETDSLRAGLGVLDATICRDGLAAMAVESRSASALFPAESAWQSMCRWLEGVTQHLGGEPEPARENLRAGARSAAIWGAPIVQTLCLAQLALLSAEEGDWQSARVLASQGRAQVERNGLGDFSTVALVFAASAYLGSREARRNDDAAAADLRTGVALLGRLDALSPWYEAEAAAALAATALDLGDLPLATELRRRAGREAETLGESPVMRAWLGRIDADLERASGSAAADLTPAELRVLRLLPTHLSFPQIAAELFVSPNTVKTQARAAYRKLGVGSRAEAVELARGSGLLDRPGGPTPPG
jgi:LuxR family transcriptional regulator, maltose regulon positive regulatory protein